MKNEMEKDKERKKRGYNHRFTESNATCIMGIN